MNTLFDRASIGNMNLKNRFVRSATWEGMALKDGILSERLINVYKELAEGEVGMIISSFMSVSKDNVPFDGVFMLNDDKVIDGYKKLTNMVHRHNSRIIAQLAYGSTQTGFDIENYSFYGPSSVEEPNTKHLAKEMTKADIERVIKEFGEAARRAQLSGFDGVELHAAHGYLLNQFLNPYFNQRTDEYGGSIENRARLIFQIYDEIKSIVGKDYPILIKINSQDFIDKSITLEECLFVCKELEKKGLAAAEVSAGMGASKEMGARRKAILKPEQEGYFKENAAHIAEHLKIPVILVGGLRSLEVMNEILNTTKIQYFSLSRPLLREPDLIKKWLNGSTEKAKCISCNQCNSPEGSICIFLRK